jgi:hypothetical protein
MKQFKFLGNPADYKWDFPLETGQQYKGEKEAYRRHSIQETIDIARSQNDKKYLTEWEEISPQ